MRNMETLGPTIDQDPVQPASETRVHSVKDLDARTGTRIQPANEQQLLAHDNKKIQWLREALSANAEASVEVIDFPDTLDRETPPLDVLRERESAYRQEYESLVGEDGKIAKLTVAIDAEANRVHAQSEGIQVADSAPKFKGWLGLIFGWFNRPSDGQPDEPEAVASNQKGLDNKYNNLLIRRELYRQRAKQLEGYFRLIESR